MHNAQKIVEMFEENMAEYTGAKYAVSCDNCTNALRMCCEYYKVQNVSKMLIKDFTDEEINEYEKTFLSD